MIYQVDHQKIKCLLEDMNDKHTYIGMMDLEELKQCYQSLHISSQSIQRCQETSRLNQNTLIPHHDYYFGFMNLINARDVFVKQDSFAFFIFKNFFLLVVLDDEDGHIAKVFQTSSDYVLEQGISITRLVYYFLSELIVRDYQYLEELQEEIEELENDDESFDFTSRSKHLGKELLLLNNYYDNYVGIGEELQMNYHHIFPEDDMRYFDIYTRRIERLSRNVQMLRELLNQAHNAHISKLDYQLNQTMQFFTVVTTIFMPLTLITGWYGMNFMNMPELNNPYAYYILIGISLFIVLGLIFWFKKRNFFKRKET